MLELQNFFSRLKKIILGIKFDHAANFICMSCTPWHASFDFLRWSSFYRNWWCWLQLVKISIQMAFMNSNKEKDLSNSHSILFSHARSSDYGTIFSCSSVSVPSQKKKLRWIESMCCWLGDLSFCSPACSRVLWYRGSLTLVRRAATPHLW